MKTILLILFFLTNLTVYSQYSASPWDGTYSITSCPTNNSFCVTTTFGNTVRISGYFLNSTTFRFILTKCPVSTFSTSGTFNLKTGGVCGTVVDYVPVTSGTNNSYIDYNLSTITSATTFYGVYVTGTRYHTAGITITPAPTPADIELSGPSLATTSAYSGSNITMYHYTKNLGGSFNNAFSIKYYLATSPNSVSMTELNYSTYYTNGLTANYSNYDTKALTIPSNITSGVYYIIAKADPENYISESNENNNKVDTQISITQPCSNPNAPTVSSLNGCGDGLQTISVNLNATGCSYDYVWYDENNEILLPETNFGNTFVNIEPIDGIYTPRTVSVSCKNGTCESEKTSVTASVDLMPPVAFSNDTEPITVNLRDLPVTLDTACPNLVSWEHTTETSSSLAVSPTETTTYRATCLSGICDGEQGSKTVIIINLPDPPTISIDNNSICSGQSATLTANGCTGIITWSNGSTGNSASITEAGTYTATCTVDDVISNSSNEKTLEVIDTPNAPTLTVAPIGTITNGQSVTITAIGCDNGTITWGNNLGTGVSIIHSPIETTTYTATCTLNECTSIDGSIELIVTECNSTAPMTVAGNRCGTGIVNLSASGCSGIYNWYDASTDGAFVGSNSSYITPSISATKTYYVSCTVGSCTSSRATAIATIKPVPSAPTVSSATINSGQTAVLNASNCSGGSIIWYNATTGGTQLGTGISLTTTPLTVTKVYYASCTLNGCISLARGSGTVTVNQGACPNQPDLYISGVDVTKFTSSKINYTVSIKNKGTISANLESVFLGVRTSSDNLRNANEVFKSQISIGGNLAPNGTLNFGYTSSFSFVDNQYYLITTIDDLGLLSECVETNNNFIKLVNQCSSASALTLTGTLTEKFYASNNTINIRNATFNDYTLVVGKSIIGLPNSLTKNTEFMVGNCLTPTTLSVLEIHQAQEKEDTRQIKSLSFIPELSQIKLNLLKSLSLSIDIWDVENKVFMSEVDSFVYPLGNQNISINTTQWQREKTYIVQVRHEGGIEAIAVDW
jgi:hypothetical protein